MEWDKRLSEKQVEFLEKYVLRPNITACMNAIGMHRNTYHKWYRTSKVFATTVDTVKEGHIDTAEEEVFHKSPLNWLVVNHPIKWGKNAEAQEMRDRSIAEVNSTRTIAPEVQVAAVLTLGELFANTDFTSETVVASPGEPGT